MTATVIPLDVWVGRVVLTTFALPFGSAARREMLANYRALTSQDVSTGEEVGRFSSLVSLFWLFVGLLCGTLPFALPLLPLDEVTVERLGSVLFAFGLLVGLVMTALTGMQYARAMYALSQRGSVRLTRYTTPAWLSGVAVAGCCVLAAVVG